MFDNLLETRRKRERGAGGYVMSVVLHVTVIGLAVAATANAGMQAAKEIREEKVNLMEVKKPPPPVETGWALRSISRSASARL